MEKKFPLIYTNKDLVYLRNKKIEEYDIKEGGFSCCRNHSLLEKEEIEFLLSLNKHERHVYLGNKSKNDRSFTKKLHEAFQHEVSLFIDANEIESKHILTIKKDSITFFNSKVSVAENNNVIFTKRFNASSFLRINKLEFFYNAGDNSFIYKGTSVEDYEDTLLEEIKKILRKKEFKQDKDIFLQLKEIRSSYLSGELIDKYYRELSPANGYRLKTRLGGNTVVLDNVPEGMFDEIDITYNYLNVILPLIKIFI